MKQLDNSQRENILLEWPLPFEGFKLFISCPGQDIALKIYLLAYIPRTGLDIFPYTEFDVMIRQLMLVVTL